MKKRLSALIMVLMLCFTGCLFCACGETPIDHKIFVTSSNIRYGTVSGDGYYKTKTEVVLEATPTDEHLFICWLKDNKNISTENVFTFEASKDTEGKYIAVFEGENMQIYNLTNFQLKYNTVDFEEDHYYQLLKIELFQKTSSENIEIFSLDFEESFQSEVEPSIKEIPVINNNVYPLNNNYNFLLVVTIKNPKNETQTYSNNLILSLDSENTSIEKDFPTSDTKLRLGAEFTFEALKSVKK